MKKIWKLIRSNSTLSLKNNEQGFTLLEVLVSLSITSLCILLISSSVMHVRDIRQGIEEDYQIEWHIFLNQLEFYLQESDLVSVTRDRLEVISPEEETGRKREVRYERHFRMIRRRVGNDGHQPMLRGLEQFAFSKEENMLILYALFQNGEEYQTKIWIDNWDGK